MSRRRNPRPLGRGGCQWTKDDQFICEDAKGHKTADYIIKRKLMKLIHNIDVVEV